MGKQDRFGAYFYRDFADEKVRVVILNYFDLDKLEETGVHGRQLKWFAEKALTLDGKDDYVALVTIHMYPKDSAAMTPRPLLTRRAKQKKQVRTSLVLTCEFMVRDARIELATPTVSR